MRILCGGPVSEDEDVFYQHLESLRIQGDLHYKGIDGSPTPAKRPCDYWFKSVDWRRDESSGEYKTQKVRWTLERFAKISALREEMRLSALAGEYDYLFMVDSDIILRQGTLDRLLSHKKDFVAPLVWTKRKPHWVSKFPNAWSLGLKPYLPPSDELRAKIEAGGLHKVEVTGCCYLLSNFALQNISFALRPCIMSEDGAVAASAFEAGIPIYLDCDIEAEHRRRRW